MHATHARTDDDFPKTCSLLETPSSAEVDGLVLPQNERDRQNWNRGSLGHDGGDVLWTRDIVEEIEDPEVGRLGSSEVGRKDARRRGWGVQEWAQKIDEQERVRNEGEQAPRTDTDGVDRSGAEPHQIADSQPSPT